LRGEQVKIYRTLVTLQFEAKDLVDAQAWYDVLQEHLDGREPTDYEMRDIIDQALQKVLPGNPSIRATLIRQDETTKLHEVEAGVFWEDEEVTA
jgi:hypothetical protein